VASTLKLSGIYILALSVAVALIPTSTYAQTAVQEPVTEAKCVQAKTKIAAHKAVITTIQSERTPVQAVLKNRIDAFIVTSNEVKYDKAAALTASRDAVSKAISTYTAQSAVYKTSLDTLEATKCTEGTGEFTIALTAARAELVKLRTASEAVKTALNSEAVPALRNYATWLKTSATTGDTE
jgi:hypothetical protein